MNRIVAALLVAVTLTVTASINATETEVHGRLYSHWVMDLTDGADYANEFALSRAYVTVKSKLSDYTSIRITTDLRETGSFDGYSIVLKYGYIDWKPAFGNGDVKFRFGLQPTLYIDHMNKLWGRRYLYKTLADEDKLLTTSDLGAGLMFNLGEKGKFGYLAANVWNGASYTSIEEMNKQKDFSGFLFLTPLKDSPDFERTTIQGQAYIGTQNIEILESMQAGDYDRSLFSFGGLIGYRKTFDLGADINFYSEGQGPGVDDLKQSGYSFFGTLYLEDVIQGESLLRTLNFFGRVDMYDPNTDLDNNGLTRVIGGIECVPVKGFKASVNVRSFSFQADYVDSETFVYLNTLFQF